MANCTDGFCGETPVVPAKIIISNGFLNIKIKTYGRCISVVLNLSQYLGPGMELRVNKRLYPLSIVILKKNLTLNQ